MPPGSSPPGGKPRPARKVPALYFLVYNVVFLPAGVVIISGQIVVMAIPLNDQRDLSLAGCSQEAVLKNVELWAALVRRAAGPGPGAPGARSSRDSFQKFRRAALQKEEREKALR